MLIHRHKVITANAISEHSCKTIAIGSCDNPLKVQLPFFYQFMYKMKFHEVPALHNHILFQQGTRAVLEVNKFGGFRQQGSFELKACAHAMERAAERQHGPGSFVGNAEKDELGTVTFF